MGHCRCQKMREREKRTSQLEAEKERASSGKGGGEGGRRLWRTYGPQVRVPSVLSFPQWFSQVPVKSEEGRFEVRRRIQDE